MVSDKYERVDVTFAKNSELEMKLYEHIKKQGVLVGYGKYVKQLILEDMRKKAAEK